MSTDLAPLGTLQTIAGRVVVIATIKPQEMATHADVFGSLLLVKGTLVGFYPPVSG